MTTKGKRQTSPRPDWPNHHPFRSSQEILVMPVILTQQHAIRERRRLVEIMTRMSQRPTSSPEDLVEFNRLEMEFKSLAALAADSSRSSVAPPNDPIDGQFQQRSGERWINHETGQEVRVLSRNESVRQALYPSGRAELGYDLGDFLRCC